MKMYIRMIVFLISYNLKAPKAEEYTLVTNYQCTFKAMRPPSVYCIREESIFSLPGRIPAMVVMLSMPTSGGSG
jgi:hypothetical protein